MDTLNTTNWLLIILIAVNIIDLVVHFPRR